MFRTMALLSLAATILAGPVHGAATPATSKTVPAQAAPIPRLEMKVAPAAPESTDRHAAPDQLPSNLVKILRTSNKAQTNSYVPVVFTLKNVNPFNVVRFLRRPVQTEEGEIYTFVDDSGKSGKVLFVVPEYMIPSLAKLVASVDRPALTNSSGDAYMYVQLRHRRAHASDPDFLAAAASLGTGDGQNFIVDPEENALYLKDAPSGGESFVNGLKNWLDTPTAMLDLTVKVYEIDAVNDTQIGLDYMAWKNGPGANLFAAGGFAEHGSIERSERVATPGLPRNNFTANGYNYAVRYDVSSAYFDYLTVKGKARLLTESKLAALNTRPAELTAGSQILYYSVASSDPSGVRDTGKPFQANKGRVVVGTTNKLDKDGKLIPVETGLTVAVTPTIGEQTIRLDLALEWSNFSFAEDTGLPLIDRKELTSTLRGKIGEEILIGGLKRTTTVKSTRKVPILGSIPVLGYAFGGETAPTRKSQMIVAITPAAVTKFNLARDAAGNLVAATSPADFDYMIGQGEQKAMDQARGALPTSEPPATYGFDQWGLDRK